MLDTTQHIRAQQIKRKSVFHSQPCQIFIRFVFTVTNSFEGKNQFKTEF